MSNQNDNPLQNDQNHTQGLQVPQTIPQIDWSKARPAFVKTPARIPAQTPDVASGSPAAPSGEPNVDWSTARPAFSNAAPVTETPDQGIVGNAVDYADKYLAQKQAEGGFTGGAAALLGQPSLGFAKGAMETLHTVGAMGSHALKAAGMDVPDITFDEPQYLEAHGAGQTVGKVGEGVLEFFLGDEALKGATMAEKLKQATKLAEFMESSPRLAAALTTGIGALRMGAVSSAQTLAHGGDADQALESGFTTGAIGGGLSGLGAISRVTSSPLLAKVATGAEIAGGTALTAKGAVSALTSTQPDETPQQSLERRVNGVVQGILGAYGAGTALSEAKTNIQSARARQTAGWLNDIEKDTFWASPTSKGKTAGATPEARTYRETIRAALPQLLEVVKDNPTASTPKEMSRAIQSRIDGVEGRLQRVAEGTQGYDESTLRGVEDDFRTAAEQFYQKNKGAYSRTDFTKAVDETVNRLRQGEGDEPRDPNLFEAENLRKKLNEETGEAPDRSSATNALKQVATRLLRDKIDQGYEDLGIKNVKEWRRQEANLITVKDQIALGEKAVETANKTPLLNRLLRSVGWAGVGTLFGGPFGSAVGIGGVGLELGPLIRDYMDTHENNPETKINRIKKNAGKLDNSGYQPNAITPDFSGQKTPGASGPGVIPPSSLPQTGGDGSTFQVLNKRGEIVGEYSSKKRAQAAVDKKDNEYGAYVHKILEVPPSGVSPKVLPASDPNASAGVIRDTGSLRRGPLPEPSPEIADAIQGTGLEFIGTDNLGLSHFHDPRTNNTLSIPTEKVSQGVLLDKLAEKAALALKDKPALPYIAKNPQVAEAEKNFVKSLADYQKTKLDVGRDKKIDPLEARQKIKEASQNAIDAQAEYSKLLQAFRQTQLDNRIESDKKYTDTFKPMVDGDVPHSAITKSNASPVRETMTHEYGHAALESLFPALAKAGVKIAEIQAAGHPGLKDSPQTLAAAKVDYGNLTRPDGSIHLDRVAYHLGDLMQMAALGGAAEEVIHGTKIKDNEGLTGDIQYMKHYMDALEIPEATQKMMIDRAFELAKEKINTPGVKEAIEKYSNGREAGLTDENLHATRSRVQAMNDEIKSILENPDAGNSSRTAGQNGNGNKKASKGPESKAAGTVPPANVKRTGEDTGGQTQAQTLRQQIDRAIEGSVRAMSLRQQIEQIGDRMPLEKARLQAELSQQEEDNRRLDDEEIGGQKPKGSGILKAMGVATGLGALAGTALKAQDKLPDGMVKVGNIDVNHRPVIHNKNGSVSTIFSVTVPNPDGTFALVPSIVKGKFLTPDGNMPDENNDDEMKALEDRATEHYRKTGEHLGLFKSEEAADSFAEKTHDWMPTGGKEKIFLPTPKSRKGQKK